MKRIFLMVLLGCWGLGAWAQMPLPAQTMVVVTKLTNLHKLVQANRQFLPTDSLRAVMVVGLADTLQVSKLHVKFGTSQGAANLLSKTFLFDVAGSFADKTGYMRKGKVVYLTLGEGYMGLNVYYAEVKLEYVGGLVSGAKTVWIN